MTGRAARPAGRGGRGARKQQRALAEGIALHRAGELDAAAGVYRKIRSGPEAAAAAVNLGAIHQARDETADAAACYERALRLVPDFPEALSRLAFLRSREGDWDAASALARRLLTRQPDNVEALMLEGTARQNRGEPARAAEIFERAIRLAPEDPAAWYNLGNARRHADEPERAVEAYERAIALKPDYDKALANLGQVSKELGRYDAAIDATLKSLELEPRRAETHVNLALCYLLLGDLAAGWREYRWRWRQPETRPYLRNFPQPQWRGEDLGGRRLLLHAEQGLGDTIQFARYLPLVAARGATVVLECQRPLLPLLEGLAGIDALVAAGDPLPPFDACLPLLDLPLVFGTTLDSIPPPLALAVPETKAVRDRRGDGRIAVGLVWAGNPNHKNDRNRSLDLDALEPLTKRRDCRFVSLQVGPRRADLATRPWATAIEDAGAGFADLGDTAAAMAGLDLVISVDTAPAHLAGTLGLPCWLLLPQVPDWRWLLERRDSPWYPSLRLFRQAARGDWPGVIAAVDAALDAWRGGAA